MDKSKAELVFINNGTGIAWVGGGSGVVGLMFGIPLPSASRGLTADMPSTTASADSAFSFCVLCSIPTPNPSIPITAHHTPKNKRTLAPFPQTTNLTTLFTVLERTCRVAVFFAYHTTSCVDVVKIAKSLVLTVSSASEA